MQRGGLGPPEGLLGDWLARLVAAYNLAYHRTRKAQPPEQVQCFGVSKLTVPGACL